MSKTKLKNILKDGESLTAKKLDVNDPEILRMLEAVRKEQEKIKKLQRKNIKNLFIG